MKFKVDENLPVEIAEALRESGHDAHTVEEEGLSGANDSRVIEQARSEARILFTLDKGVASVRREPSARESGVVLFRPGRVGRGATLEFVLANLKPLLRMHLAGRITVVAKSEIRVR